MKTISEIELIKCVLVIFFEILLKCLLYLAGRVTACLAIERSIPTPVWLKSSVLNCIKMQFLFFLTCGSFTHANVQVLLAVFQLIFHICMLQVDFALLY